MVRTSMAFLLMAILLYLALRIEVFKPLWQLTADAKEIARGNFRRRSLIDTGNEIGELAREFNILAVYLQQREEENERLIKNVKDKWVKAEAKSQTDFLTNLENHRSFQDRLATELDRASRNAQSVSLLFCDLDKFKAFNDTNGHQLGDKALFDVARIVKQSIRPYDLAARYGGEEFAIILPNTSTQEAVFIAERIRQNVAMYAFTVEGGLGHLTISIGVATFPDDAEAKELLITSADYAMYESKKLSGNTVSVFTSFGNSKSKQAS
jgi:diguanylate cyclase (GGDEF)-like protein